MYEMEENLQRAVLAAVDLGEYDVEASLDELEELARTAGAEVVAKVSQKRPSVDAATVVGGGKLREIADFCRDNNADILIFDHELSATQLRNIEKAVDCDVVDRTMLILDIFAQRARTREGRLQVELAQLKYRLPRLSGLGTALSRLGGGIGTRGPGETKLESDRRHIRRRIDHLQDELEQLERRRSHLRARRQKDDVMAAAIVGYTNVGKSTLLNTLTDAGVLAEDKLFATLDPTARRLTLPDGRQILLIDTVGLVRRLPHHLVEAFKSTLEEALYADVILNVCDITAEDVDAQLETTRGLLAELKVQETPVVTVFNKCDLVTGLPQNQEAHAVYISAKDGYGLDALLETVARELSVSQRRLRLLIPYDHASLLSQIRVQGKVMKEAYTPDGIETDALVDKKILPKVSPFIVS
ncbi:GTPase HflX [Candidatus Soleaferrea massiliensis]|uniref:GTPase HflX n=1 Tax=Candidatus Soleaferrea massiliensis TaxID=1470354 RepID=UPI00058FB304|nr:GTPase HflX [Candidatus Soleaferrea massiliensis]